MQTVERKIKRGEVESVYRQLIIMASQKKQPLKRCIAFNVEILNDTMKEISSDRDNLLMNMIMVDENGEYALKEGEVLPENATQAPLSALLYEDGWDERSAKIELENFDNEEISIELRVEDINKSVKVSSDKGFEVVSLEALIEDPNNDLTPGQIVIINKFLVCDSITDNI